MKYLSKYKLFESNQSDIVSDIDDILLPLNDLNITYTINDSDGLQIIIEHEDYKRSRWSKSVFLWKDIKLELSHLLSFLETKENLGHLRVDVSYASSTYYFYEPQELDSIVDDAKIRQIEILYDDIPILR